MSLFSWDPVKWGVFSPLFFRWETEARKNQKYQLILDAQFKRDRNVFIKLSLHYMLKTQLSAASLAVASAQHFCKSGLRVYIGNPKMRNIHFVITCGNLGLGDLTSITQEHCDRGRDRTWFSSAVLAMSPSWHPPHQSLHTTWLPQKIRQRPYRWQSPSICSSYTPQSKSHPRNWMRQRALWANIVCDHVIRDGIIMHVNKKDELRLPRQLCFSIS